MSEHGEGQEPLERRDSGREERKFTFHKKSQNTDDETLERIEKEKDRDQGTGDE